MIVGLVEVDVMHHFGRHQRTPQHRLGDNAMDMPVSFLRVGIRPAMLRSPVPVALPATELVLTLAQILLSESTVEGGIAERAVERRTVALSLPHARRGTVAVHAVSLELRRVPLEADTALRTYEGYPGIHS
jgi:hypothetical protein